MHPKSLQSANCISVNPLKAVLLCSILGLKQRYVDRKELLSLGSDLEVGNVQIQAGSAKHCIIVIVHVKSRSRILFTIYF
jgi:hypothetical protein